MAVVPAQSLKPQDKALVERHNFDGFGIDYKERSVSLSPLIGIPLNFGPGDVGVLYQLSKTSFYR